MDLSQLLDTATVARMCNCSRQRIYTLRTAGRISVIYRGGRAFYLKSHAERLRDELQAAAKYRTGN